MEPTLTTFLRGEAGFAYYAVTLIVPALSYVVYQVLYQLYLSPLAKFPGPNLAAVTRLYEVHYDLVLDGQHTFKIKELHRDYGEEFPSLTMSCCSATKTSPQGRSFAPRLTSSISSITPILTPSIVSSPRNK